MMESKDESLPDSVLVSVALPPGTFDHTNVVGAEVLHAAVLPVVVGLVIGLVEGTFSMGRFAEAWPVTVLFVFAYLGGVVAKQRS
ncbi:formate hydrogenlyase subunit 4 [Salinibacter ruber]|nr:formate hydrogenlyase subunit 4 [Salinibacter ruber]